MPLILSLLSLLLSLFLKSSVCYCHPRKVVCFGSRLNSFKSEKRNKSFFEAFIVLFEGRTKVGVI